MQTLANRVIEISKQTSQIKLISLLKLDKEKLE